MSGPRANAVLVEALGSSLRRGGNALQDVPDLLKRILREQAWKEFVTPRGELIRYDRFSEFVVTPPTAGMGTEVDLVRRILAADIEALDLFDAAVRRPASMHALDNIQGIDAPSGTSREAGLRRLRKHRPDLHAEVLAGRLSTHAAMVQAGFRRKVVTVPVDRPEDAARALKRNLPPEAVEKLAWLLTDGGA